MAEPPVTAELLSLIPFHSIFQRLPGVIALIFIPFCLFAPFYMEIIYIIYYYWLHFVFVFGTVRQLWGSIAAYRKSVILQLQFNSLENKYSSGVLHVIIIPQYKEEMGTIFETLDVLASHSLAKQSYVICLAMEEGEAEAVDKANLLIQKYSLEFKDITFTLHPRGIEGEIRGKSSNTAYAAKEMLERNNGPVRNHVYTVMDADTCFAETYFWKVGIEYEKMSDSEKDLAFFCPPTVFDRNADKVPFIVRAYDMQWSLGVLSYMIPQSPVTAPCSAYSISSVLAHNVGGWDSGPSAIGEDYHMYLKCFFSTRGGLKIVKIFSPASQSNIEGSKPGFWSGFSARYIQAKRHWWASLDVGYTIRRSFFEIFASGWDSPNNMLEEVKMASSSTSTIYFLAKLVCVWYVVFEEHFFLSQAIIMIATSSVIIPPGLIPDVSNGYWNYFSQVPPSDSLILANSVGNYSRLCGAGLYILGVIAYEFYQEWNGRKRWSDEYRGKIGKRSSIQAKRGMFGPLDWLSFPLFSVFYVIIPQMHAQIAQLWTENLDYVVAAKPNVDGPVVIEMEESKDQASIVKGMEPVDTPVDQRPQAVIPERMYRNFSLPFYYPSPVHINMKPNPALNVDISVEKTVALGIDWLCTRLGLLRDDLNITNYHRDSSGTTHIYLVHVVNDLAVDNHQASLHIQFGQVISWTSSFRKAPRSLRPYSVPTLSTLTIEEATYQAENYFKTKRDHSPHTLKYIQLPNGDYSLCYQFQLRDDAASRWYQISVDSTSGKITQAIDYYASAKFKVIAIPNYKPTQGFEFLTDPAYRGSSPHGWNSDGVESFSDTRGNNVDSRIPGAGIGGKDLRVDGGSGLVFSSEFDPKSEPTVPANQKASVINNFYVSNMMHDISYQYGFTEAAGNFQTRNFEKGGKGNDRVDVKNQAVGTDNANFATPPDGQPGIMQMYTWSQSKPARDGSLENDVPIHEYTHGISNRLTGGSFQANCLSGTTPGGSKIVLFIGMGEGWSDAMAIYISRRENENRTLDVVIGDYVYNNPNGIRKKPYSTSMTTNPYTLSYVGTQHEVHDIGEYWANILYEMYWNLVDKHGFTENIMEATQKKGNIIAIQLLIGGLKIQPCNPSFSAARDAILAADQAYYNAANRCQIWDAFAKRGLGIDAVESCYKDGFNKPIECGGYPTSTTTATSKPTPTTTCIHDKCITGEALDPECDPCVAKVIAADSFCKISSWDSYCVKEVTAICGIPCASNC